MPRKTCLGPFKDSHTSLSGIVWLLIAIVFLFGCTPKQKVLATPRIKLAAYNNIGIIEFTSNGEDWVKAHVTQNFMQRIQSAQPDVRFIELGSVETLMHSIGATRLDSTAIKILSGKYDVKAIFTGHLEISYVKPEIRWNPAATAAKAEAYLEGTLTTRLMEGISGATLWTLASTVKKPVGAIKINNTGPLGIRASEPESARTRLIHDLVYESTRDFYPYYAYQPAHR